MRTASIYNAPLRHEIGGGQSLINSMYHLLESRLLFAGFMTGSYYSSHYKNDRLDTPDWEMEKRSFEYRYRYETAFLAAFKGIECFLGVNDIKKNEVDSVLKNCKYDQVQPGKTFRRFHEIFLNHKEYIPYDELIQYFLLLRNVVAAHNNQKPPDQYKYEEPKEDHWRAEETGNT